MYAAPATDELHAALDRVVAEILGRARVVGPPVDAFDLARGLGISVAVDRRQQPRARQKRIAGRPSIFLRPEARSERLHWAVAHEIGEHESVRVFRLMGWPPDEITPRSREVTANMLAARLLMPTPWITSDARASGYDLPVLKKRYSTASHESIAWRTLDFGPAAIVTLFDHGQPTCRRSNLPLSPPALQPIEWRCWRRVHEEGGSHSEEEPPLHITGWAIHEDGWKREILRTEIDLLF